MFTYISKQKKLRIFVFHIRKLSRPIGKEILRSRISILTVNFMNSSKKVGRPDLEIKRDKTKLVLFTSAEFEKMNMLFSESSYQNVNDMIRDVLLNGNYKVITLDQDLKVEMTYLVEQTRRIGNNFNQLIKQFNQKKLNYFTEDDIKKLISNTDDIKELYIKIENIIKK